MENCLKAHSSWNQMKAVERASERVHSWPEWKRSVVTYRRQDSQGQSSLRGADLRSARQPASKRDSRSASQSPLAVPSGASGERPS